MPAIPTNTGKVEAGVLQVPCQPELHETLSQSKIKTDGYVRCAPQIFLSSILIAYFFKSSHTSVLACVCILSWEAETRGFLQANLGNKCKTTKVQMEADQNTIHLCVG